MNAEVVDEAGHDAGEAELIHDGSILVVVFRHRGGVDGGESATVAIVDVSVRLPQRRVDDGRDSAEVAELRFNDIQIHRLYARVRA